MQLRPLSTCHAEGDLCMDVLAKAIPHHRRKHVRHLGIERKTHSRCRLDSEHWDLRMTEAAHRGSWLLPVGA